MIVNFFALKQYSVKMYTQTHIARSTQPRRLNAHRGCNNVFMRKTLLINAHLLRVSSYTTRLRVSITCTRDEIPLKCPPSDPLWSHKDEGKGGKCKRKKTTVIKKAVFPSCSNHFSLPLHTSVTRLGCLNEDATTHILWTFVSVIETSVLKS